MSNDPRTLSTTFVPLPSEDPVEAACVLERVFPCTKTSRFSRFCTLTSLLMTLAEQNRAALSVGYCPESKSAKLQIQTDCLSIMDSTTLPLSSLADCLSECYIIARRGIEGEQPLVVTVNFSLAD
ncbi:MAG: hypothetical protein IJ344_05220 [Clostridia bacterium]|nr:hypothetical protein [Clostridia bacterium]